MDQKETPLFDALLNYKENQLYSFHVPGHKDGLTIPSRGKRLYESILSIDATEVYGLDDLYEPAAAIAEAQTLVKELYKTVKSYFLVNGSTVGNLVMIMSACRSGDKVLVQRNSHKSIFNALKLAKVEPVFLSPDMNGLTPVSTGLNKGLVEQAIQSNPDAKALILTYPNYYGMAKKDYQEIIRVAKKSGLLVLVDEAHGAHFILGDPIPESTLRMGADIVVHSAHKTLPAMTMGSFLHVNSEMISTLSVEQTLEILQTSSPSYPIMASLDLARAYLASIQGNKRQQILESLSFFKKQLNDIGFHILTDDHAYQDPFKIVLSVRGNGFELQESMQQAGLYPEMADPYHLLITLAIDDHFPFDVVLPAFKKVRKEFHPKNSPTISRFNNNDLNPISTLSINYRQMEQLETEKVLLNNVDGRLAAQMVVPYPPGVPILVEGEMILQDHVEQIRTWKNAGARFHGLDEDERISVYKID